MTTAPTFSGKHLLNARKVGLPVEPMDLPPEAASAACTVCPHEDVAIGGGECVCRNCGLVLESGTLVDDEFAFHQSPLKNSSYYAWQRAVRTVLQKLGLWRELSESFGRPFDDASVSEARKKIAAAIRLEVIAAYCILVRFGYCISSEEARKAGGATSKEWRRAAEILGDLEQPDETALSVFREARSRGIPDPIARATLEAMHEPRLECCDPSKVLAASVGESLGDDLAASLFRTEPSDIAMVREKYQVQSYAADMTPVGLCLELCVERCRRDARTRSLERAEMRSQGLVQSWWQGGQCHVSTTEPVDELLQTHLKRCTSCAFRAQELGLSFLLKFDMNR